jgi:uncharacterized lipoprotein NlpE involved in copper resistance
MTSYLEISPLNATYFLKLPFSCYTRGFIIFRRGIEVKKSGFTIMIAAMLLGGCGGIDNSVKDADSFRVDPQVSQEDAALPVPFTMDKLQQALDEYINYRLWYYPENTAGTVENASFDAYIGQSEGQSIDVEIRSYGEGIYASLPKKEWLVAFEEKEGIVYTEGQIDSEMQAWPGEDYTSIGSFRLKINEPRKPVYGDSPRKTKMIEASLAYLDRYYNDVSQQGADEEWKGTTATLVDFYEYEAGTAAWLVRKDGTIYHVPMYFDEENDGILAVGMKGYHVEDAEAFGPEEGYRYLKEVEDASIKIKYGL